MSRLFFVKNPSRPIHLIFLVIVAVGLASFDAWADQPAKAGAEQWLASMRQAMAARSYRGLVAYLKDNKVESFKLFHAVLNGVEQERLLAMNSPMREVVRTAEKVTCYFPDSRTVAVEQRSSRHSFLLNLPEDLEEISEHYAFQLGGVEHIAQRPAQMVIISPRDDYRYGRRVWIDVENKLPLKFELIDDNNQVVEQVVFTSLSVESTLPPTELAASTAIDDSWTVKQHQELPIDSLAWALEGVPDGFRLKSYSRVRRSPDSGTIDHILLSDGFSSVSVYMDELKNEFFIGNPRKFGAINSFTRKAGRFLVTVMGEVPAKTVQSIGNGIRQQTAPR